MKTLKTYSLGLENNRSFLNEQMKNSLCPNVAYICWTSDFMYSIYAIQKKLSTHVHTGSSPSLRSFHERDVCLQINTKQNQKLWQVHIPQHRCTSSGFLLIYFPVTCTTEEVSGKNALCLPSGVNPKALLSINLLEENERSKAMKRCSCHKLESHLHFLNKKNSWDDTCTVLQWLREYMA